MKMRRNIEHEEEEGHIRPACNDDTLFTKKKPSQVVLVSLASQEIHRIFFVSKTRSCSRWPASLNCGVAMPSGA